MHKNALGALRKFSVNGFDKISVLLDQAAELKELLDEQVERDDDEDIHNVLGWLDDIITDLENLQLHMDIKETLDECE